MRFSCLSFIQFNQFIINYVLLRFGIFPSWGLSQKLSRIIGPMRARQVSLTAMPIPADMAERWGLVNHVVDHSSQALPKAQEIARAIARNHRDLVLKYKAVINDGFKLDLASALALEKVGACLLPSSSHLISSHVISLYAS
jgi:enoyl-CoA hydratase/carnithine racemase